MIVIQYDRLIALKMGRYEVAHKKVRFDDNCVTIYTPFNPLPPRPVPIRTTSRSAVSTYMCYLSKQYNVKNPYCKSKKKTLYYTFRIFTPPCYITFIGYISYTCTLVSEVTTGLKRIPMWGPRPPQRPQFHPQYLTPVQPVPPQPPLHRQQLHTVPHGTNSMAGLKHFFKGKRSDLYKYWVYLLHGWKRTQYKTNQLLKKSLPNKRLGRQQNSKHSYTSSQ